VNPPCPTLYSIRRRRPFERGIFVFDISTELGLVTYVEEPPSTHWFGDRHLFVMDARDAGDDQVVWDVRIFERFARVSVLDQRRSRPTARSERLHFVCRK
jgi:hypothetical protein